MSQEIFLRIDLLNPASNKLISEIKQLYIEVVKQNTDKIHLSKKPKFTLVWFVEIEDRWWKMLYVLNKTTGVVLTALVEEITYGDFQTGMLEERQHNPHQSGYQEIKYNIDDD